MAKDRKYGNVVVEKGALGHDEPVFLLRAQDPIAYEAIMGYRALCAEAGCDEHQLSEVAEAARSVREWQEAHPTRMKVRPDTAAS